MLTVRGSSALDPVEQFQQADRGVDEDNLQWVQRQLDELGHDPDQPPEATWLLLVGGTSIYDFRLRVAQSHLRHDMTPSHWSHAALISTVDPALGDSLLLETSLDPQEGFQVPSMFNGVQGATLDRYADPAQYPNVALIKVPVGPDMWLGDLENQKSILGQFAEQRVAVDVPSLILEWLGFVWGAGTAGNPILSGHGIPSAAVIESLIGAAGYDLCPGLDSAASSPEAFWQTAKWWQASVESLSLPTLRTRYFTSAQDGSGSTVTPPTRKRPAAKKAAPAKKAAAAKKGAAAKKAPAARKRTAPESAAEGIVDLIRTSPPQLRMQASKYTQELFRRR
ncbi:hypothetical protein OHA70_34355 [Kribbella sp. NBC_00382]|uniref:hypothetical protein n=1 Tax=Kribbella sp. NBC_00382 TaxID=2975967 RepID=UPI002E213771